LARLVSHKGREGFGDHPCGRHRALLARALNLPLANSFQLRIDSGSVHKLRRSDDYLYVEYINL